MAITKKADIEECFAVAQESALDELEALVNHSLKERYDLDLGVRILLPQEVRSRVMHELKRMCEEAGYKATEEYGDQGDPGHWLVLK